MRLIGRDLLRTYEKSHADIRKPLQRWMQLITSGTWRNIHELRQTFRTVDAVGVFTIFDIKGNAYRLETRINYKLQICRVTWLGTHAQYDKRNDN